MRDISRITKREDCIHEIYLKLIDRFVAQTILPHSLMAIMDIKSTVILTMTIEKLASRKYKYTFIICTFHANKNVKLKVIDSIYKIYKDYTN